MSQNRRKVLCITLEPISKQMAGPAIRCVELARQLAEEFAVTVVSPRPTDLAHEWADDQGLTLITGLSKGKLYQLAADFDILFIQANVLKPYPALGRLKKYLVVDLYDPYLLSLLAQYDADPLSASASYRLMHKVLEKHMLLADFSLCASERQRDYYIGRYCALGRLTPELYRFDPSFRKLVDVVPFGLPKDSPVRTGTGMRGTIDGINTTDFVLIWGGGIWQWFDPLTVIQAVAQLSQTHNQIKLFFMGWKSPNPQVELMPMAARSKDLARQLGLLNRQVFFGDDWIPYEQRVNYLLDADVAVSAHFDLPETRLSFRTRILDYLWAGLPILTTGGDQLSETIEKHGAGISLPYGDVSAWACAIEKLFRDSTLKESYRQASLMLSSEFVWEQASQALRQYCRNPHRLPPFTKITMPSLVERLRAVHSRGGTKMVLARSQNIIEDFLRK